MYGVSLALFQIVQLAAMGASGGWAIVPGHERLFSSVTVVAEGELPTGWARRAMHVPRDRVEVFYGPRSEPAPSGCAEAPICLKLTHASANLPGARIVGPFAVSARGQGGGPALDKLLDGVAARIEAANPRSPFKEVHRKEGPSAPAPPASAVQVTKTLASGTVQRFKDMLASDPDLLARVLAVEVEPEFVRYVLRVDSGDPPETAIELHARTGRHSLPQEITRSFHVRSYGGVTDPPDLARRLHAAVLAADDGSIQLKAGAVLATGERPPLHVVLIVLVIAALLGLLVGAVPLGRLCRADLREERLALGLLIFGAILRLGIPPRLVEMGIGYQLTRYADDLRLPRYGAGTTTLHNLIFQVFGTDHDVMIATHRVLGILTLPLAFAAGLGLVGAARARLSWLAPTWAAALAFTPMLLKSDATESNMVPVLFALWAALLAWQRLQGVLGGVITLAGLAFVALSRPEMAVVGPGIWLILGRPWTRWRAAAWVLVPLIAVITCQLIFVQQVVDWEMGLQSIHLDKGIGLHRTLRTMVDTALFDPRIAPLLLTPLGLASLWVRDARAVSATLLLGGLAWSYVYAVDLSPASMPRLHIVVLIAWSLPASVALAALAARRRAAAVVVALAWAVSAGVNVPWLWAPTNEDTQERLYDAVEAAMPEGEEFVLATLSPSDAPDPLGHYTHRHVPNYLFQPGVVAALGDLDRWLEGDQPVYYFQGTSCYARLLRAGTDEEGPLAPCVAVHRTYRLESIWQERVTNYGNPTHMELGYYGAEPHFDVGLWRVVGRADTVRP